MRLGVLLSAIYHFTTQYCYSYRQLARTSPDFPTYQYPPESPYQGEQFVLYPGKYDITLRRPDLPRRHKHRRIFPVYQKVYSWDEERALHQPPKMPEQMEPVGLDNASRQRVYTSREDYEPIQRINVDVNKTFNVPDLKIINGVTTKMTNAGNS